MEKKSVHALLMHKEAKLFDKRRAEKDEYQRFEAAKKYYMTEEPAQFKEYFYPDELQLLKTNNFESYMNRKNKTDKYFKNEHELKAYLDNLTEPSSHNEDRPPPSEEKFFDSDDYDIYDRIMDDTSFAPKLTKLQTSLLLALSRYIIDDSDGYEIKKDKKERRKALIRGFLSELRRKRYSKTFRRFTATRARKMDLAHEATELIRREISDKGLNRLNYYEPNEPHEFGNRLMNARKNGVRRKFIQYFEDPKYRRAYRDRVYHNVNQDVPVDDHLDFPIQLPKTASLSTSPLSTVRKSPSLQTRPHRTPRPKRIPRVAESKHRHKPELPMKMATPRTDAVDWHKLGKKTKQLASEFKKLFQIILSEGRLSTEPCVSGALRQSPPMHIKTAASGNLPQKSVYSSSPIKKRMHSRTAGDSPIATAHVPFRSSLSPIRNTRRLQRETTYQVDSSLDDSDEVPSIENFNSRPVENRTFDTGPAKLHRNNTTTHVQNAHRTVPMFSLNYNGGQANTTFNLSQPKSGNRPDSGTRSRVALSNAMVETFNPEIPNNTNIQPNNILHQSSATLSNFQTNQTVRKPDVTFTQPNATFTQANTTFTQPYATFAHPNATFTQPNETFTHPNATLPQPNVTFTQPNAACTQPNTTFTLNQQNVTSVEGKVNQPNASIDQAFSNKTTNNRSDGSFISQPKNEKPKQPNAIFDGETHDHTSNRFCDQPNVVASQQNATISIPNGTSDRSSATFNGPNATVDRPNATFDRPNATFDRPNATFDRPNATFDRPNATFDRPNATFDRPNATFDRPNATFDRPNATFDRPNATFDRPNATFDRPNATFDRPNATFDRPNATFDRPNATFDRRNATFDRPNATFDRPNATFDRPNAKFDRPNATFDRPNATFDRPNATFDRPNATFDRPNATYDHQIATFDRPNATFDRPNTTFDRPNTTFDRPISTANETHSQPNRTFIQNTNYNQHTNSAKRCRVAMSNALVDTFQPPNATEHNIRQNLSATKPNRNHILNSTLDSRENYPFQEYQSSGVEQHTAASPIDEWLMAQPDNASRPYDLDDFHPLSSSAPHASQFDDSDFELSDPYERSLDFGYRRPGDKKEFALYKTMVDDPLAIEKKRERAINLHRMRPNQTRVGDLQREIYAREDRTESSDPEQDYASIYDCKVDHYEWMTKTRQRFQ